MDLNDTYRLHTWCQAQKIGVPDVQDHPSPALDVAGAYSTGASGFKAAVEKWAQQSTEGSKFLASPLYGGVQCIVSTLGEDNMLANSTGA